MTRPIPPWIWHGLTVVLFVAAALIIFHRARTVVTTPEHGDQAAYLELAINLAEGRGFVSNFLSAYRPYPEITRLESMRAPLYPLLLAPFAERDLAFFARAKTVTALLSLAGAALLWFLVWRRYGPPVATVFVGLLLSNTHFIIYASELWCENLLMTLSFAAGWLWWHGNRPVAAGILAGLALLAKKVMVPLVGIVLLVELASLLFRRLRSVEIEGNDNFGRFCWLLWFLVAYAAVLLPFVAVNLAVEGEPFNNVDVSTQLWLDQGPVDAWQIHDELPTPAQYFQRNSLPDILAAKSRGMLIQLQTFAYLGSTNLPGVFVNLGWFFWPLAAFPFVAAWKNRPVASRALVLMIAFLFLMFSWYEHITVSPRFIYLLLPVMLLGGILGLQRLADRFFQEHTGQQMLLVMAVLLTLSATVQVRLYDWEEKTIPFPQADAIQVLQQHLPEDAVLATGPSHWFPYLWLFPNKVMFVPAIDDFPRFVDYMERFDADYLFIDPDTFNRRTRLFLPIVSNNGRAPGFETVAKSPDFVLLKRLENSSGEPHGSH